MILSGNYRGYDWWVRRTDIGIVTAYIDIERNTFLTSQLERDEGFVYDSSDADKYVDVHGGCTFLSRVTCDSFADGFRLPDGHLILGWDYGHFDDIAYSAHFSPSHDVCRSIISEQDAAEEVKTVIEDIVRRYDI